MPAPVSQVLVGCLNGFRSTDQSMPSCCVTLRDTSEISTSRFTCTGVSRDSASTTGVSPETARMPRRTRSAWDGSAAVPLTNSAPATDSTSIRPVSPVSFAATALA